VAPNVQNHVDYMYSINSELHALAGLHQINNREALNPQAAGAARRVFQIVERRNPALQVKPG